MLLRSLVLLLVIMDYSAGNDGTNFFL